MRKGFVYLLMTAVALISLGTLNSCKDYEDDLRQEARINQELQNITLIGLLDAAKADCQKSIDSLKTALANCSTLCDSERIAMKTNINDLKVVIAKLDSAKVDTADFNSLKSLVNALELRSNILGDSIFDHEKRIAALEAAKTSIDAAITALTTQVGKITNLENRVTKLEGRADSIDNFLKDTLQAIKNEFTQIQIDLNKVSADMKAVESRMTSVETTVKNFESRFTDLKAYMDTMRVAYQQAMKDQLKSYEDFMKTQLDSYKTIIDNYNTNFSSYVTSVSKMTESLATISTSLANLGIEIGNVKSEVTKVNQKAADALALAKLDSTWIKQLQADLAALQGVVQTEDIATNDRVDSLNAVANSLDSLISDFRDTYDETIDLMQDRDSILTDSIWKMNTTLSEINTDYQAADKALNERIDTLAQHVAKNEGRIKKLEDDLAALTTRVDNVENAQKALISSIEIQQAFNPVFGTYNLPADVRSTILFGYYGESKRKGEFPSPYSDGCYVSEAYSLSDADYNVLNLDDADLYSYKSGDILVNGGKQLNIGTVYLTVNPTEADLKNTEFTLENSAGDAAPATLSNLKASNHDITFGYTRAKVEGDASPRGFYEATASIKKGDVIKSAIKTDGLKDAVKMILQKAKATSIDVDIKKGVVNIANSSEINISDVAITILDNLNGITDAYAVKATWNDPLLNKNRSVYSQYGLAATAIKNICGYNSFIDFDYKTVPGYEQAIGLIDKFASSLKNQIKKYWKKMDDLSMPKIKYVNYEKPSADDPRFKINIAISFKAESGYTYTPGEKGYLAVYDQGGTLVGAIPFGEVTMNSGGDVIITAYDKDIDTYPALKPMFDAIDNVVSDVNQTYDDLKDLLDNVNSVLHSLDNVTTKIGTSVDKYAGYLQKFLSALNSKLVGAINSANTRLQPVMISTNDTETRILGFVKDQPRAIPASTTIIMTNLVGEVVAPALKKHLACTNVYKDGKDAHSDANLMKKLKAFNAQENINTVLDGATTRVDISGLEKGYTYEIALSCLDYEGMQSTRKQYVIVK